MGGMKINLELDLDRFYCSNFGRHISTCQIPFFHSTIMSPSTDARVETAYRLATDFSGRPPPPKGGYNWGQIKAAVGKSDLPPKHCCCSWHSLTPLISYA